MDVFVDCTLGPDAFAPIAVEGTDVPIARIVCQTGPAGHRGARPDPHPLPSNGLPERMDFAGALRFDGSTSRTGPSEMKTPYLHGQSAAEQSCLTSQIRLQNTLIIHLHGHSFRLLDALDDGWKPFWLDTLPLAPATNARIAFVADNPGKWLIEGLAGKRGAGEAWFEVT